MNFLAKGNLLRYSLHRIIVLCFRIGELLWVLIMIWYVRLRLLSQIRTRRLIKIRRVIIRNGQRLQNTSIELLKQDEFEEMYELFTENEDVFVNIRNSCNSNLYNSNLNTSDKFNCNSSNYIKINNNSLIENSKSSMINTISSNKNARINDFFKLKKHN